MKPVRTLTRAELQRALDLADRQHMAVIDEMIKAGRGHETPSETARRDDPLSLRFNAAAERSRELYAERSRRMAYHGNEHRTECQQ